MLAVNKLALKSLGRRYRRLSEEISGLEKQIARLVSKVAPHLLVLKGLSTDTAAVLLVAAGDNPERSRSEAAFPTSAGWHRFPPPWARLFATTSIVVAIGMRIELSTRSPSAARVRTNAHVTTFQSVLPKARANQRLFGASSVS